MRPEHLQKGQDDWDQNISRKDRTSETMQGISRMDSISRKDRTSETRGHESISRKDHGKLGRLDQETKSGIWKARASQERPKNISRKEVRDDENKKPISAVIGWSPGSMSTSLYNIHQITREVFSTRSILDEGLQPWCTPLLLSTSIWILHGTLHAQLLEVIPCLLEANKMCIYCRELYCTCGPCYDETNSTSCCCMNAKMVQSYLHKKDSKIYEWRKSVGRMSSHIPQIKYGLSQWRLWSQKGEGDSLVMRWLSHQ
jgi:hypothetical protein